MRKPLRPCNHVGCTNLTNSRYCTNHEYILEEQKQYRNLKYNRHKRDTMTDAFYKSMAWEKARQQALIRDHGICLKCKYGKRITVADMVDHIIPIKQDWEKRLDLDNLQSLCHSCHNTKTAEDKRLYEDG